MYSLFQISVDTSVASMMKCRNIALIFLVLDSFNWLFIVGYVPPVKGIQVREKTNKIHQSSVDETLGLKYVLWPCLT